MAALLAFIAYVHYEFSETYPRPQLNVRLRPRPSTDAQQACGYVRVRTSLHGIVILLPVSFLVSSLI